MKYILLTADFPFGKAETYIENEMMCLPQDADIDVLPTRVRFTGSEPRPLPANAHLRTDLHMNLSGIPLALSCVRALFSPIFRNEIRIQRKKGHLTPHSFAQTLSCLARAEHVYRFLTKEYAAELRERSAVFYSYWLLFPAIALSKLSKRFGVASVSRAHNGDLYNERAENGFFFLRDHLLEGLTEVRPCSVMGADYLKEHYPDSKAVIRHAYLGTVDHGVRSLSALPSQSEKLVIASCSHIVPVKRLHLIAAALSKITDRPIKWIHFGAAPDNSTAELEKLCAELPENIEFSAAGHLQNSELLSFYKNNDVHLLLNVSSFEGLPVSIMEAISFGIPVAATNVGGTDEVVRPEFGVLLENTDEETLTAAIVSAIRRFTDMSDKEYLAMRSAARAHWLAHFNCRENYAAFYADLAGLGAAARTAK